MYVVFSAMVVFTILNLIYADFNLKKNYVLHSGKMPFTTLLQ